MRTIPRIAWKSTCVQEILRTHSSGNLRDCAHRTYDQSPRSCRHTGPGRATERPHRSVDVVGAADQDPRRRCRGVPRRSRDDQRQGGEAVLGSHRRRHRRSPSGAASANRRSGAGHREARRGSGCGRVLRRSLAPATRTATRDRVRRAGPWCRTSHQARPTTHRPPAWSLTIARSGDRCVVVKAPSVDASRAATGRRRSRRITVSTVCRLAIV